MIWRIQDQATFAALRRSGIRGRSGPIGITFLAAGPLPDGPDPTEVAVASRIGDDPPRLAFAIGRRVGHAVVRNRMRRRLRAMFAELHRQDGGPLRPGAYLVACQAGVDALNHEELREHVLRALTHIDRVAAR